MAIVIRPYQPTDRPRLRQLCHDTGYMGASAAWYWRHADSFADIWTGYYTDHEPESLWVATDENRMLGYLAGCVDSRRALSPATTILRAARRYGLLLRPGTAGFLWRGIVDALRPGATPIDEVTDPRWPSHLHINLRPDARGRGVGKQLMAAWFNRLRAVGSPGCHLGTLAENATAIRFFTSTGFRPLVAPLCIPGMRSPAGDRHHLQVMVREV